MGLAMRSGRGGGSDDPYSFVIQEFTSPGGSGVVTTTTYDNRPNERHYFFKKAMNDPNPYAETVATLKGNKWYAYNVVDGRAEDKPYAFSTDGRETWKDISAEQQPAAAPASAKAP